MKCQKILFAHIPKTAGTSFRTAVEEATKENPIIKDYGPHTSDTSKIILECYKNGFDELRGTLSNKESYFLSGHFQDTSLGLSGYRAIFPEARIVTFLRDPIERAISEFWHFKDRLNFNESFSDFIKKPSFINRQGKSITGIPIESIDFVGVTERYSECLEHYNEIFDTRISHKISNQRSSITDRMDGITQNDLRLFCKLNMLDIALYNKALILTYRMIREKLPIDACHRHAGSVRISDDGNIVGWGVDYFTPYPASIVFTARKGMYKLVASELRKDLPARKIHASGYAGFQAPYQEIRNSVGPGKIEVQIVGGPKIGTIE